MATASFDLGDLWRYYCAKAMGIATDWESSKSSSEEERQLDANKKTSSKRVSFVSLIPQGSAQAESDAWIQTAKHVQDNIQEMKDWIRSKKKDFRSLQMSDQEASIIQSTVTSFCAQTANEIESLHSVLSIAATDEVSQHRLGIVQILMGNLKEDVAEDFKQLSKKRKRPAIDLWQTPLQCRHIHGTPFQPTRPTHRLHMDFWDAYAARPYVERPVSMFERPLDTNDEEHTSTPVSFAANVPKTNSEQSPLQRVDEGFQEQIVSTDETVLQQEAVLLQQVTNNDLDAVQKMEEMMVNITTLISQFASLVSEQQEDVYDIHNNASEAKEHMTKGQENLADAKERTRSSQHYMAKGILAMAILLLLLHWLLP